MSLISEITPQDALVYSTTFLLSFIIFYIASYRLPIFGKNKRIAIVFSLLASLFATYWGAEKIFLFLSHFFSTNVIILYILASFVIIYGASKVAFVGKGKLALIFSLILLGILLLPFLPQNFPSISTTFIDFSELTVPITFLVVIIIFGFIISYLLKE